MIKRNVVIHCSATENGKHVSVQAIDAMHAGRGFVRTNLGFNPHLKAIGYHFVIEIDGSIKTGRACEANSTRFEHGAHAYDSKYNIDYNDRIGICMIGGIEIVNGKQSEWGRYTKQQWQALNILKNELLEFYQVESLLGHRDLSPDLNHNGSIEKYEWVKSCPCFDVQAWAMGELNFDEHTCEAL